MRKQPSPSENRVRKSYSIFDMKYLWAIFNHNKKYFLLSVLLCLLCAGTYVYFSRPTYNIVGKMLLVDRRQNNNAASASMALLNQLPLNLGSSMNFGRSIGTDNEIEILKANRLSKEVVEDLKLFTEYRLNKNLKSILLYKTQPLNVTVSPQCLQIMNENLPLKVYHISLSIEKRDAGYTIEGTLSKKKKKTEIDAKTCEKLPAVIHTEIGDLTISENKMLTEEERKPYVGDYCLRIDISPSMMVAKQFVKRLTIATASKKATSIVKISLLDESMIRGVDYVNSLVEHYNYRSNCDKQEEAAKNEEFINSRIAKIDQELSLTDADWEKVKKQYQVTDPKVDAEEVMEKKSLYESQLVNYGVQQQLLDYLSEYVNDQANLYELIPINIGIYNGDAVSMISRHNQLVTDRKMLLKSVTEQSSQVKTMTQLLDELHPVIQMAIQRDRESLSIKKRVAQQEFNRYMNRVGNAPEQERLMTDVSRQRSIKQSVFVSLLQKREEIAMELANTTDKGKMIDETQALKKVKPKTLVALFISLILGMLIPYIVFFTRRGAKKVIDSEIDLKVTTKLPLVGTIPALGQGDINDAFRLVRNNILPLLGEGKKTILVVSANNGDGKTFCSTQLAESFARMGEKTICRSLLDVLPKDTVDSAHPADLLARKDLHQALVNLRESYDIIILDGPEIEQCNEALIGSLADVICFVCRAGKTQKTSIKRLELLKADNQATPCVLLNQI